MILFPSMSDPDDPLRIFINSTIIGGVTTTPPYSVQCSQLFFMLDICFLILYNQVSKIYYIFRRFLLCIV